MIILHTYIDEDVFEIWEYWAGLMYAYMFISLRPLD